MLKDALPYTGFGPAAERPMRILPVAKALRQVAPCYSRTVSVRYRLDKATIVAGGCTDVAQLAGKQFLIRSHWSSRRPKRVMRQPSTKPTLHDSHKFLLRETLFTAYHFGWDSRYVCPCNNCRQALDGHSPDEAPILGVVEPI